MNEREIIEWLYERFNVKRGYKYQLNNTFVFGWESDFLFFTRQGYAYEGEIKTNRADFFADFNKKEKHKKLAAKKPFCKKLGQGYFATIGNRNYIFRDFGYDRKTPIFSHLKWIDINKRPNKFFYVVPEGLIEANEVPDYAGLMYYGQKEFIKKPPFIHKNIIDCNKTLLDKFYYLTLKQRS